MRKPGRSVINFIASVIDIGYQYKLDKENRKVILTKEDKTIEVPLDPKIDIDYLEKELKKLKKV